ncbi:hypothetical protein CONPUDRAFT_79383 [Coniophora puteana RWD-64-598 SS2]|uniref:DUF7137 domain-containing protein n=1 Tax=Coniophora puteana (strain RWD-64-598) TaxID=741705 RepID=A0A5M3N7V0_CONPW|nr:uncharacterized protein CONPUDRAFT_79383 [Coniophora puteana RWD-64-598 SS2]EIW87237.1 hypothetical protein CONPUDRAFT_79383 [Coniophora puteana RWD-64-598 SS2]
MSQSSSNSNSQPNTGSQSGSGSASGTGSSSGNALPSIPANAPQGQIVITQPPQQSTSYYKVAPSQTITFGWNFTDLYVTPTSLTISAVCSDGNTYPVGPTNGIIPGDATSVEWYPYGYQQSNMAAPFAQATYTLHIWGDQGPSAVAAPGYLTPNSDVQFALYTPEPYTPLTSGWQCPGCSGSMATYVADPAFVGVAATLLITVLSGFGMLNRIPL